MSTTKLSLMVAESGIRLILLALVISSSVIQAAEPQSVSLSVSGNPTGVTPTLTTGIAGLNGEQPHYLGIQSCSSAACHGSFTTSTHPGEIRFDEVNVWFIDPHAKAYQVLFESRSEKMFVQLGVKDSQGKITDPVRFERYWQQCLACHDPLLFDQNKSRRGTEVDLQARGDGVSCEGCHGPASEWLALHYRKDWKTMSAEDKQATGFKLTNSPTARAKACGSCHVGDQDRDVNHDLIGAGHPAMKFELTWYEQRLPPHWNPERRVNVEPALDAWLAGQLMGAELSLKQLERRTHPVSGAATAGSPVAGSAEPNWPEFAEYRCFACHKELAGRGAPTIQVSTFPYGPWEMVLLEELAQQLASPESKEFLQAYHNLVAAMNSTLGTDPEKIRLLVKPAQESLHGWQRSLSLAKPEIATALRAMAGKKDPSFWDRDAQLFLGLAAPFRTSKAAPPKELIQLRDMLVFPQTSRQKFDSPRNYLGAYEDHQDGFDPQQITELHTLLDALAKELPAR